MALETIAPYSTEYPMKVRDTDTGAIMQASYDSNANVKLDQVATLLQQVLAALAKVSARLDAGIKTQALGIGITVPASI